VLSKNIKTKNGISYNESDHNIISTKLNIKWSAKRVKVMEVFKYNDPESLKMFKHETTNTDQLSKLIDMEKPIHIVTKKFLKRIDGFVNQCFKKVKIVETEDKKLQELYNTRRLLRTKTDEESQTKIEELNIDLANKYSEVMSKKILSELKNVGDSEDGGFNAGHLWKLKKKLSPRFTEPHTAMMNADGKLLNKDADIRDEAVKHYKNVFKPRVIKEGLEDIKDLKDRLCKARLESTSKSITTICTV
jgi:hypothetical protein